MAPELLRVTGFLEKGFGGPPRARDRLTTAMLKAWLGRGRGRRKWVMYATTTTVRETLRPISEETCFEMLSGVTDFAAALARLPEPVNGIVKAHPGAAHDKALFRAAVERDPGNAELKYVCTMPVHLLIDLVDVVVVHNSSVAGETLLRGKHVIVYAHTRRPSYLKDLSGHLNSDPARGTAIRLAWDIDELQQAIAELMARPAAKPGCPGFDRYLANAAPDYDHEQILRDLGI